MNPRKRDTAVTRSTDGRNGVIDGFASRSHGRHVVGGHMVRRANRFDGLSFYARRLLELVIIILLGTVFIDVVEYVSRWRVDELVVDAGKAR